MLELEGGAFVLEVEGGAFGAGEATRRGEPCPEEVLGVDADSTAGLGSCWCF